MISRRPARVISPAPRPRECQGKRLERGGLVPSFSGFLLPYFVWQRVAGTLGRKASGTFLLGRGVFLCPLRSHFHTHVFSLPQVFFCLAFEASIRLGERYAATQRVDLYSENGISTSECYCMLAGGNAVRCFCGTFFR